MRTDSSVDQGLEDDKEACRVVPGTAGSPIGALSWEEGERDRSENVRRACRWRRATGSTREEQTPEGKNPMSVTCLRMAGRWREEEAAARLEEPVSGTVVDGVGATDVIPG